MRIAVLSWSSRVVGGVEEYLRKFLPAAVDAGHEIGFWYETDAPRERAAIPEPPGGGWSFAELGPDRGIEALRAWRPDVIYAHGLEAPELEERAYSVAPTVFFAHDYHGTCISGAKMTKLPVITPCHRTFGPACLLHYFPRRCGGLNPLTMWRQYRLHARHLAALHRCAAVVTHSQHMRDEYARHGLPDDRVLSLPYYVTEAPADAAPPRPLPPTPTLLFLGRMESLKGGRVLLAALPRVRAALGRPLRVVMAGEGRDRAKWEAQAAALQARDPELRIEFPGWVDAAGRAALLGEADLLVVPSLWPEPFGQVGPEAGMYGVPAAAFAVGGTPSWLTDGVNGHLAPGDTPTTAGLADAIARCLADPAGHARLREGAVRLAARFTWDTHYAALMAVFNRLFRGGDQPAGGA